MSDGGQRLGGADGQPRQSLSDLFSSLLSSLPSSSSSLSTSTAKNLISQSEPALHSPVNNIPCQNDAGSMRHVRTRPPSPRILSQSSRTHSIGRLNTVRSAKSMSVSLPPSSSSQTTQKYKSRQDNTRASQPTFPVLQWFSGKQQSKAMSASRVHSRTSTQPRIETPPLQYSDSPIGVTDSPSSSTSHLSALADALRDDPNILAAHSPAMDLPSRPEAARLPPPLRPWRPPSHLSELSRTTLPTACVSPMTSFYRTRYIDPYEDPYGQHEHNPDLDIFFSPTPIPLTFPHSPAPAHLSRSPLTLSPSSTHSSIDTLRSIQERGIHTTPPSRPLALPSIPNPFEWFSENFPSSKSEDKLQTATVPKHIRESYASPKNPVVFCHGLLGFDTVTLGPSIAPFQVTHWRGIKDALEANGTEVLITRVPATSSPIDRAKVLEKKISEVYPDRAVHLIGHSMGGLDCRYLTTHLTHRKFKVLSITTIATPHRGSYFADHFLATIGRARIPNVVTLLDLLPNGGGDGKAFEFLTVENMRRFNKETPDVEGVKYYSWGAVYEPGLIDTWKWSHSVVLEKEGPNDGLVSLKSARWGTYLGTLEGVNHLDLIGWVNTTRYKWAEIMGREIKFKPTTFYLGIADHLARVAEGQTQHLDRLEEQEEGAEVSADEREEIRQEGDRVEMAESLSKGTQGERSARESEGKKTAARANPSSQGIGSAQRRQ